MRPAGLYQLKYLNDRIGNRTRELAACSAARQRNAPPHEDDQLFVGCMTGCNVLLQERASPLIVTSSFNP